MAIVLPYPNLNFVPLDVLTAEELNEIVANVNKIVEYVPDFPLTAADIDQNAITTTKISNGAVTNDKISVGAVGATEIDWSSAFPFMEKSDNPAQSLVSSGSWNSITSMSLSSFPTNARVMVIAISVLSGTDAVTGVYTRLKYGSTNSLECGVTNSWGRSIVCPMVISKTSSTSSVSLEAMKDNNTTVTLQNYQLYAFRIG